MEHYLSYESDFSGEIILVSCRVNTEVMFFLVTWDEVDKLQQLLL